MFFLLPFERNLRQNYKRKKSFYEIKMQKQDLRLKDLNSLITSLCFEYIGEFMALNQKDHMPFSKSFINLLPN